MLDHDGEALGIPSTIGHAEVHGNSMAPVILEGQHTFIDMSGRPPRDGDLVLLQTVDGETYAKSYFEAGNMVQLTSVITKRPPTPQGRSSRALPR